MLFQVPLNPKDRSSLVDSIQTQYTGNYNIYSIVYAIFDLLEAPNLLLREPNLNSALSVASYISTDPLITDESIKFARLLVVELNLIIEECYSRGILPIKKACENHLSGLSNTKFCIVLRMIINLGNNNLGLFDGKKSYSFTGRVTDLIVNDEVSFNKDMVAQAKRIRESLELDNIEEYYANSSGQITNLFKTVNNLTRITGTLFEDTLKPFGQSYITVFEPISKRVPVYSFSAITSTCIRNLYEGQTYLPFRTAIRTLPREASVSNADLQSILCKLYEDLLLSIVQVMNHSSNQKDVHFINIQTEWVDTGRSTGYSGRARSLWIFGFSKLGIITIYVGTSYSQDGTGSGDSVVLPERPMFMFDSIDGSTGYIPEELQTMINRFSSEYRHKITYGDDDQDLVTRINLIKGGTQGKYANLLKQYLLKPDLEQSENATKAAFPTMLDTMVSFQKPFMHLLIALKRNIQGAENKEERITL